MITVLQVIRHWAHEYDYSKIYLIPSCGSSGHTRNKGYDVHLGKLAALRGGGGHKWAAGFECTLKEFTQWFT